MSTITAGQVLTTVEQVGGFVAGFFPGAAPAISIAEQVIPLVGPGILAAYQAIFGSKPANVTDESWLALLQTPSMTKSATDYIKAAQASLPPVSSPTAPAFPTPVAS